MGQKERDMLLVVAAGRILAEVYRTPFHVVDAIMGPDRAENKRLVMGLLLEAISDVMTFKLLSVASFDNLL